MSNFNINIYSIISSSINIDSTDIISFIYNDINGIVEDLVEDYYNSLLEESFEHLIQRQEDIKLDIKKQKYDGKNNEMCVICYENIEKKKYVSKLKCNHIFHYKCISEWGKYKQECPLCRQHIIKK